MASHAFHETLRVALNALVSGKDLRAALLMTNTTADTERTITLMNAFATLDECDAGGYARVALASEAVATDAGNNRAEFDATDVSFTGLGGDATRDYQGVLIYEHVTNDTDSIPRWWIEFASTESNTVSQVDIPWNAEGIVQQA